MDQSLEHQFGAAIAENNSTPPAARSEVTIPYSRSFAVDTSLADSEASLAVGPLDPGFFSAQDNDGDVGLRESRTTIKGGVYSSEDADELDDGFILNVAWTNFFNAWFGLEFEAGYFTADGEDGGIDGEVWGIPLMANARLNIPIWVLDLYGGAGLGGFYYDAEVGTSDDSGFLFGGNAFLGATVNLADSIALGLEAKYYVTEDIDDFDTSLDALAIMLTVGFSL